MIILQVAGAALGVVLGAWILARVVSAAYFKSQREHEQQRKNDHGTRQ